MTEVGKPLGRVCVFCGSHAGAVADYRAAAEAFARELVARRIHLVFGGGRVGLMGHLADAVLAEGGHAIGVIPDAMIAREIAHTSLPDLRVVRSMHERKSLMARLSDAFVALPGDFGTIEELAEALTWTQLGLHRKRCGLLNVRGYYDPLLALFDRAQADGFVRHDGRDILVADANPAVLLDRLAEPMASAEAIWLRSPDET